MRAAAAAGHELTARTAAAVLADGGNAVDATVAAAAMSWAAEPGLISPCGGGFLLVRPARSGKLHLLDAFTAIPGHELPPDRVLGAARRRGRALRRAHDAGLPHRRGRLRRAGRRCRPGAVHRRFGSPPWRDLADARGGRGRRGGRPDGRASRGCSRRSAWSSTTRPRRGSCSRPAAGSWRGRRVRQPALAGTIEQLAESPRATLSTAAWRGRWSTTRQRRAAG